MKILILGGTTFFGKEAARLFLEKNHEVTVFTRGNHWPEDLPKTVRHIKGDRTRPSDLEKAAKAGPWDCVIDNIAYDGNAVRAATSVFREADHYILTSTISVYRYSEKPSPWKEEYVDHEFVPERENLNDIHWKYARGKWEAEKALLAERRLSWTIFRPTIVYGPFDPLVRGAWYLARLETGGPILVSKEPTSFQLVYSKDVAQAFYLAAQKKPRGRIFNLSQRGTVSLKEFLEKSAVALGKKLEVAEIDEKKLGDLGGPHGRLKNIASDSTAVMKDLGLYYTPFDQMCRETALWFQNEFKGDRAKLLETRDEELKMCSSKT